MSFLVQLGCNTDKECVFYATATLAGLTVARSTDVDTPGKFVEYTSADMEVLRVRSEVRQRARSLDPGFHMEGSISLNNFKQCLQELPLESVGVLWVLWTIKHFLLCRNDASESESGIPAAHPRRRVSEEIGLVPFQRCAASSCPFACGLAKRILSILAGE